MESYRKYFAKNNRLIPIVLLTGLLLLEGCTFSSHNNGILSNKPQDPIRIIEYQLDGVSVTRMDYSNTEKSCFFIGDYDTLVQKCPEVTIDWSVSHEMAGWILFKNDSVVIIPQIGLGIKTKESSNSFALMDYEDCWQLNLNDYEKSIWCIEACNGCDGYELADYETKLTKLHFPNTMVVSIPISEGQGILESQYNGSGTG